MSEDKYVIDLDFGTDSVRALVVNVDNGKEESTHVVNYKRWEQGKKTVGEIKDLVADAYEIKADVSNRDAVNSMIKTITKRNELDILINNAVVVKFEPFLEITKEAWDFQMNVNLVGAFNVGQEVARYFVKRGKGGSIVFISSFNQEIPNDSQGVYSITKGGIMINNGMMINVIKD